ncbi:arsenate reductase family protein [Tropicimonas sp.]|uniref:arsenate reductase family protein n=1 Tax=Tropicimonas sp. TaxID=2067044 RepID=UPI003A8C5FA2
MEDENVLMILYGIPTCDTCRKARKALETAGFTVVFRDVRAKPLSPAEWAPLIAAFGADLVNRRSTAWRSLGEAERGT